MPGSNIVKDWRNFSEYKYQTALDTTIAVPSWLTATTDANNTITVPGPRHDMTISAAIGSGYKIETTSTINIDVGGFIEINVWNWRMDANAGYLTETEPSLYIESSQIGVKLFHDVTDQKTKLFFKNAVGNGVPNTIAVGRVEIMGSISPNANRVKHIGLRLFGREGRAQVLVDGGVSADITSAGWPTTGITVRAAKVGMANVRRAGAGAHWMTYGGVKVNF